MLPNLASLHLGGLVYCLPLSLSPGSPEGARENAPEPFHLKLLSFGSSFSWPMTAVLGTRHHKSSISGLFCILSPFSIDVLDVSRSFGEFDSSIPLDSTVLHRPISVKNLRLLMREWPCSDSECRALLINTFAESIASGGLRSLTTHCCSLPTVSTIEKLLVHDGADLTNLDIGEDPPDYVSDRGKWEDPLDSTSM